jgi:uncharacterized protein (UPF0332 family)
MKDGPESLNQELDKILGKAQRMLLAAEAALQDGFVETAASRAYYAAFHAIQALLKSVGQTYSKHAGVIGAFHRDFVKTKIFPDEFGKALTRPVKHRDIGDYSYIWELDPEKVREDVRRAGEILDSIRRYLQEREKKEPHGSQDQTA